MSTRYTITTLALMSCLYVTPAVSDTKKVVSKPKIIEAPGLERKMPKYPMPSVQVRMEGFQREFKEGLEYPPPKNRVSEKEFNELVSAVRDGLGCKRDAAGKITGKPIYGKGGYGVNQFLKLLQRLDHVYGGGSEAHRQKIHELLNDCLEHFNSFDPAPNVSWTNWANYGSMRPAFTNIYRLIQKAPEDLADTFAEKFFVLQALSFGEEVPNLQMDHLKGYASEALRLPIAIRNPQRRLAMVKKAHDYAQRLMMAPGNFTPEGGLMHHSIWHYYYAHYSTSLFFECLNKYHRAGWYFSEAAYERIQRVAYAAAFITAASHSVHPLNGGGRPGLVLQMGGGVADWLNAAAQTGYQGDPKKYHPLFAGAFLHYYPNDRRAARFKEAGIEPKPMPDGHLTMNIGAMAVHRRDGKNVTVAGLSPATYKHEIYSWVQYNNYSQYARWGSHIITSPEFSNPETEGGLAVNSGFDWAFIPGATCPATPPHRLIVRRAKSYISNGDMSGGCHLDDDGVWGQHQNWGAGAHFKKSAFFFDDRITFITTNVNAVIPKNATEGEKNIHTCLAQWPVKAESPALFIDAEEVKNQPEAKEVPLNQVRCVVDSKGNAYVIHENPNARLKFRRGKQSYTQLWDRFLVDPKKNPMQWDPCRINGQGFNDQNLVEAESFFKPRVGDYELAWIHHDRADGSVQAGSVYHLLPFAGKEEAEKLKTAISSGKAPFKILQQDSNAHVLQDLKTGIVGYVIFGKESLKAEGIIESVDHPATCMVRQDRSSNVSLAIAIPLDRKLMDTIIILRGRWRLSPVRGQKFELSYLPDGNTKIRWIQHDYTSKSLTISRLR